jgi:uncharacterized protein
MTTSLPLFPLEAVLFPGGRLPLRIFESRYIDMVRECMRNQSGFGVVWRMDTAPEQAGGHARIGTEAIITDFSTLPDGLLGIDCQGTRRFLVRSTRARDNGLLIGKVEWLHDLPASVVAPRFAALQTLMREILQNRELAAAIDVDVDEAGSLGFALASLLRLDLPRAQKLLEMTDPDQRLELLLELVGRAAAGNEDGSA